MGRLLATAPHSRLPASHRRHGVPHYAGRALLYGTLVFLSVVFLVPLFWMVTSALKPQPQLFVWPPVWIPDPPQWQNFGEALTLFPFGSYIANTLYISIPCVVGTVLTSSFTAYGFSRIDWPGRDKVFAVVLSTLMLPFAVTMIPLYLVWRNIGLIGIETPLRGFGPLILPMFLGGGAFNIFLCRQFFMTIPQELSEAARMDGCSELRIYWQIILPLARPVLATISLFTFLGTWNDFLGPLIYLTSIDQFTVSIGLRQFQFEHGSRYDYMMAASTVTTLPIIALFFFAQRTFIQGITLTGIKA